MASKSCRCRDCAPHLWERERVHRYTITTREGDGVFAERDSMEEACEAARALFHESFPDYPVLRARYDHTIVERPASWVSEARGLRYDAVLEEARRG